MSRHMSKSKAQANPPAETRESKAPLLIKRGAYLGPSAPPVEMTQGNFINPTPTDTPLAPTAAPATPEGDSNT